MVLQFIYMPEDHRDFIIMSYLKFRNPCDFRNSDCFLCSWQVTAVTLWNELSLGLLLYRGGMGGEL